MSLLLRGLRRILRAVGYLLAFILLVFLLQRSTYPLHINWNAVSAIVGSRQFDYVAWEVDALTSKAAQALWGEHPFMTEAERSQYVRDYMADLATVREIEAAIEAVYTDPAVDDPETATAEQRAQRDALRVDLRQRQTTVESILEGQVATILTEQGFGTLGQLTPPIAMHFTQMPQLLVVSPRDRIDRVVELAVEAMPVEEAIALEERIAAERDMAALIVPLGGMALYPAMINETASIPWAVEVFAHEWVHHYLFFYPLGANYFTNSGGAREALIINETTADTFGKEIRELVLQRYYPDLAAAQSTQAQMMPVSLPTQAEPAFDFGWQMHMTRTVVDKNLADVQVIEDKVDQLVEINRPETVLHYETISDQIVHETEAFMEQRRQLLYDNGWRIRKLNQAYFAFYGGYQAGSRPGVGGEDPIGPAVQEIRQMSDGPHEFIVTMRSITTRDELLSRLDAMRASRIPNARG